ncbi:hypothetical protein ACFX1S_024485 [Malus domestica]
MIEVEEDEQGLRRHQETHQIPNGVNIVFNPPTCMTMEEARTQAHVRVIGRLRATAAKRCCACAWRRRGRGTRRRLGSRGWRRGCAGRAGRCFSKGLRRL